MGISVSAIVVPFTADDGDRCLHEHGIVSELPFPCVKNILEGAAWHLDGWRRPRAAVAIGVEELLTPVSEVPAAQYRRGARRDGLRKAIPLVLQ